MSQSELDRLIQMINQIAINNISAGDENAVAEVIASHVQKFWSRRMKAMLSDYVEKSGEELHPAAKLAAEKLLSEAA
ncbi:formate dehydrogenase subunit delta [Marinobacterium sp. YM272]|uniref:formate dehydrogenase subunit delta n=1 Tax=Marinobacterium sp. YM272 TaxID=3421654 RepID=UPI003D7F2007